MVQLKCEKVHAHSDYRKLHVHSIMMKTLKKEILSMVVLGFYYSNMMVSVFHRAQE